MCSCQIEFEQSWLFKHPWPKRCIPDNGGGFNGHEFQESVALCTVCLGSRIFCIFIFYVTNGVQLKGVAKRSLLFKNEPLTLNIDKVMAV